MRRTIAVLSVMAVVVAMTVATVAPAFAAKPVHPYLCTKSGSVGEIVLSKAAAHKLEKQGFACTPYP